MQTRQTHLVERDHESAELAAMLQECARGTGVSAVIGGGIGCGKTELMRGAHGRAERSGYLVLSATSSWAERHVTGGVLARLLHGSGVELEDGGSPAALLESVTRAPGNGRGTDTAPGGFGHQKLDAATAAVLHELGTAVLRRSVREPVLLCVDDVQFTDPLTLHWLLLLLRRSSGSRVAVVMTECTLSKPAHPWLHAELLRQPGYRRLTLGTLSASGVARVLAQRLGKRPADELAAEAHAVSGGNPFLVRALAEDCRDAASREDAVRELAVGDAYGDTVLSCLHRGRPLLLRVAQALAVCDERDAAELVARALDLDEARVRRAVHALESAGLVGDGRLRHPVARQAVRDSLGHEERSALHRRVAGLLYARGAAVTRVARHVLAVEGPMPAWAVPLLGEAAERFLATDRAVDAHACVAAALGRCEDETERVALKALLASTAWALNPSISARHLGELAAALREGRLPERHALMLAKHLLWHGRFEEAVGAFEWISGRRDHLDPREAVEVRATRELLASTYPALVRAEPSEAPPGAVRHDRWDPGDDPRTRGAAALSYVLAHGPHEGAVTEAEAAMRALRLTEHTQEWLVCAVSAVFFADHLELAGTWCDHWLAQARERQVPLWAAEFASLRASFSLRQGDPAGARRLAESALTLVRGESWGVCVGGPLAHLVRACTDTGDREAAAEYLDMPVPEGMFKSRFGLYYLHARGRYHLEVGRPHAALGDFLTCGELMRRWGIDQPTLVPWRSEAARAHLALGEGKRALSLAREQVGLAGRRGSWAHAVSLRAVAAASPARERPPLLTEAVEALKRVGDRSQLAGALLDLGRAYGRSRGPVRARPVLGMAARIAEETGARPLLREIRAEGGEPPPSAGDNGAPRGPAEALDLLSGAERRVAVLAARGHTNREIAERLAITMSTVEQHLTRVFRKLGVRARRELPAESVL